MSDDARDWRDDFTADELMEIDHQFPTIAISRELGVDAVDVQSLIREQMHFQWFMMSRGILKSQGAWVPPVSTLAEWTKEGP